MKRSDKSIDMLKRIRINPKIMVSNSRNNVQFRTDLEFYIPQILAHYFRTDLSVEQVKQIEKVILKACQINHFFAHKIWFNLMASLINKDKNEQIGRIIFLKCEIENIIKKSRERLYYANSKNLMKLINDCELTEILDDKDLTSLKQLSQGGSQEKHSNNNEQGD